MIKPNKNIKRVYISAANDCPFRILDAIKLKNYFTLNNFKIVDTQKESDYNLYITCSATKPNIANQLDYIKNIKKSSGELIVMGCMPGTNQEELSTIFSGKTLITKNITDIDNFFPDFKIKYNKVPEVHNYDLGSYVFFDLGPNESVLKLLFKYGLSKTFYRHFSRLNDYKIFTNLNKNFNVTIPCFLKISTGCTNNCSYCNIRDAIGKIKSKSIDTLIKEYSDLLEKGYRLFHFVAEDICSYGMDINSSLIELINALSAVDKVYHVKWSFEGINPGWLVKFRHVFAPLIKSKKIWGMTICVEYGSDRIIELMNRKYKIKEVEKVLIFLRKKNPGLILNGMFIEGFPTETEFDFNKTLQFLRKVRFDNVTISTYSEFEKRASAKIFPKVADDILQDRMLRAKKLLIALKTPVIRGDLEQY